jgi:hypothetical protein
MGGQNEVTISGLRMHVSNCKVHIHDDSKKLKYERTGGNFKAEVKDLLKELEDQDGTVKILGETNVSLFLVKEGKGLYAFLSDVKSVEKDLLNFIKDC